MKYLRIYEEMEELKPGDYIVLLYPEGMDKERGFIKGGVYIIHSIFKHWKDIYSYNIRSFGSEVNLKRSQFRKASDEEVAMFKYNL